MASKMKFPAKPLHPFNKRIQALAGSKTDTDGSDSGYSAGKDSGSNNSSITSDSVTTVKPRYNLRGRMKNGRGKTFNKKAHHAKVSGDRRGRIKNTNTTSMASDDMEIDLKKHGLTGTAQHENENGANPAYSILSCFQSMFLESTASQDQSESDTSAPLVSSQAHNSHMDIPSTQQPGTTFYLEHHSDFKAYDTENDADDEGDYSEKIMEPESDAEKEVSGKRTRETQDKFPRPKRGANYWIGKPATQ
ncbi:MAG: hypothetical protein MMC33_002779 [Icmadophila ericetorum]|nr:hypothetical protein [Icmadophila ericetorum]